MGQQYPGKLCSSCFLFCQITLNLFLQKVHIDYKNGVVPKIEKPDTHRAQLPPEPPSPNTNPLLKVNDHGNSQAKSTHTHVPDFPSLSSNSTSVPPVAPAEIANDLEDIKF